MENVVGLLLLGLLLRGGLADVSHLPKPGHNQYLPPPIQNLPVEQDYNGIDSQRGYVSPHNSGNRGYLPPYQDQHHHHHHHDDHHQQQHQDPYDPHIQVSYHNNDIHHPHDQVHGHHDDLAHDDHVEIDHQQLEPVFPSNFPSQQYLAPTAAPHVHEHGPSRGEGHSISLGHYNQNRLPVSSPAPFSLPPERATPLSPVPESHTGYQYLPPAQPTQPLHENQAEQPNLVNDHHHANQSPQRGYLPPPQPHSGHVSHSNGVSNGHLQQQPHQDYLPPGQSSHGLHDHQSEILHQDAHHHHEPHQDNLLLNEGGHGSHSNHGHPAQHQELHQDYLPPNQESHGSHLNHGHSAQHSNSGGSILNNHHSGQSQQEPQQDYLPPIQSNHLHQDQHHYQSNHGNLNQQSHQAPQEDYLPPLSTQSSALHIVPPPQLGLLTNEPKSQLAVRGHVNVPLPIPQVGYFFIPGVVSTLPSLTAQKTTVLQPALNFPAPHLPPVRPTQHISSPEYTRAFLFQKANRPVQQKSSNIVITPSVQTSQQGVSQNYVSQQHVESIGQTLLDELGYLPPNQNNLQTPAQNNQQSVGNRGYLPPVNNHNHALPQQNFNHGQGSPNNAGTEYIPPDNISNRGLGVQNVARSQVSNVNNQQNLPPRTSNYQGRAYLPPINNHHQNHHHDHHSQGEHQAHHHNHNNAGPQYLPPPQQQNYNQVTNLQTYMNSVHPNDRYGSLQYHNPPPNEKGNPPPPVVKASPMYSKPSAIRAYAPGMAYKVSTNTPFSTFTPAAYLPAVKNTLPQHDQQDDHHDNHHDDHHDNHHDDHHDEQDHGDNYSIGFQLNEEAKRNLAKIMPKDNTVFPLEELFDLQDNDIDMPQLMEQLRGRVRTVQIINNHANTVKNIKVLETSDHAGVKTIKILGHSKEDPMGEHKVVRVISQGAHPDGVLQTVKIFSDHKEVTLPTQNAYLPPPKAKETYVRVLRHSQDDLQRH